MQQADDFWGLVRGDLIENQMATYWQYSIARPNMVASLAKLAVVGQLMECMVEFGQVAVSLFTAPGLFGEYRNTFQVCSGCCLDSETRYQ